MNTNWLLLAAAMAVSGPTSAQGAKPEAAVSQKALSPEAQAMRQKRLEQKARLEAMHEELRAAVAAVRADQALTASAKKDRIKALRAEHIAQRKAMREKFKAERMELRRQRKAAPSHRDR